MDGHQKLFDYKY